MAKYNDQKIPGHDRLAFASPFKFNKMGKSGIDVSEVFPKLGECVDDMAIIRSMWTDIPAHPVAQRFMHTGSLQIPKPSMGSWVLYGLGTENQNMPGFITIGGTPEWRNAVFLPGYYQGVNVNYSSKMDLDDVILNIRNQFTPPQRQRRELDLVHILNEMHARSLQRDEQLEARIEAFELAFKMQAEATDAFDISKEPAACATFTAGPSPARNCWWRGGSWSAASALCKSSWAAGTITARLPAGFRGPREVDQPAAGLIKDLKQRRMLDSTLVIWGGEFGRTPTRQDGNGPAPGRDHHGRGFCAWLAGGGAKGGTVYGATDDFGDHAVDNKMHIHDLHATILRLLGFDHTKLTYRYNGRDFRLTDNFGNVARGIIA